MYVTRVQLTGIKGFSGKRAMDVKLPARGGWTVLAGRNGSGKSTLLQALALALSGPAVARSLVSDSGDWISAGSPSGHVDVRVQPDTDADSFVGKGRTPKHDFSLRMQWDRPAPEAGEQLRAPGTLQPPTMEMQGLVGEESAARGPWAQNPRGWFCAGYGPFRRLTGGSSEAQRIMRVQGPTGRMATLFHEDASLAEGVSWLIDLRLRSLETRGSTAGPLLEKVLALLQDGLLPDQYQIRGVTADGLWVAEEGRKDRFPLREMSDGYRAVAALVLDMVRQIYAVYGQLETATAGSSPVAVLAPGVVLIDEVDAHLHVIWQRKIGVWLREHFPHIQFIVSSHSPYICQAADEGGLIRLPGPDEQRPPAVVDEDLYRRVVYGSSDDAVLSELFGLETPYSRRAEEQRKRLVALERKVYAQSATREEIAEYQELSRLLTSSVQSRVAEVAARLEQDR
ncbi:AAA family ATPase [Streptomyces sp. NBC_01478]|uniref:AAA family ATPase n=1 Tax=Streptomyces sp. NBC_01478 TaxID=2903882 RepID=UPI002E36D15C|nr:AAA family ATPase [Streptomyces sp. NBC_01478]